MGYGENRNPFFFASKSLPLLFPLPWKLKTSPTQGFLDSHTQSTDSPESIFFGNGKLIGERIVRVPSYLGPFFVVEVRVEVLRDPPLDGCGKISKGVLR
jgi:hypothetical protein